MSNDVTNLVEAMRNAGLTDKPKVDDLAELAGVDKVSGADRDAAWDIYQDDQNTNTGDRKPIKVRAASGVRFCRAGRCFGKEPTTVDDYTDEQLDAWKKEQRLVVEQ